jgi:hypothetical protein
MLHLILRSQFFLICCLVFAQADLSYAADKDFPRITLNSISEPTVAENIKSLDTDHDGIVTVYEVRAFVEARHGKGYKVDVLDDMESSAGGKSCSSPFSKPLY